MVMVMEIVVIEIERRSQQQYQLFVSNGKRNEKALLLSLYKKRKRSDEKQYKVL